MENLTDSMIIITHCFRYFTLPTMQPLDVFHLCADPRRRVPSSRSISTLLDLLLKTASSFEFSMDAVTYLSVVILECMYEGDQSYCLHTLVKLIQITQLHLREPASLWYVM